MEKPLSISAEMAKQMVEDAKTSEVLKKKLTKANHSIAKSKDAFLKILKKKAK